jgi:uncharacterized protein YhaN
MRIEQVHIDGYGLFCDFSLDDLSPASTVISGPNESGKTTLLSFFRTILFGFLDRRSTENLYKPLKGGRHGGLLKVTNSQCERFILERHAGPRGGKFTLTLPDGSAGSADDLAALLGHTSRDLFRSVFAFSLSELQDFETLSSEDIRSRIYGAGFGAGRMGLPEIEKTIEKAQSQLYKQGGRKQVIAALLREASEVRNQLRTFDDRLEVHNQLQSALEDLNQEAKDKSEERRDAYAEREHLTNLLRGWNDWTELRAASAQIDDLPVVKKFPEQGIERFERLRERADELGNRVEELRNGIAASQQELEKQDLDQQVLSSSGEIEGLNRGLDKYESAKQDLPKRGAELRAALTDLQKALKGLGMDWDEDRVNAFDTSVLAREAVRSHADEITRTSAAVHDAERDEERAKDEMEKKRAEHARLEEAWKALTPPPELDRMILERDRHKIRELRRWYSALEKLRQEKAHLKDRKSDLEARCISIGSQISREESSLPAWPGLVVPLIGLLVGMVFAWVADWITAAAIAGFGVVLGVAYAYLRRSLAADSQKESLEGELRTLLAQLRELEGKLTNVAERCAEAKSSLETLREELGIKRDPDDQLLDEFEDNLGAAFDALAVWEAEEKRVKEAAHQLSHQESHVNRAKQAAAKAQEEQTRAQEIWSSWLRERNIDGTTRPDTCLELFSMVESLREKIKALDGLRRRVVAIEDILEKYEERTNLTRQTCHLSEKVRNEFPGAVDELIELSRAAKEKSEKVEQLQNVIDKDTAALKALEMRAEEASKEISRLLAKGGASNEEDFRKRAKNFEERERLQAIIRERKKNLRGIVGSDRFETFLKELEATDPERLKQMKREVTESIEEIEKELDEKSREFGRINEQIRVIESEEESSELRLRLAMLQETLQVEAGKWAVLTIGRTLLAETRLKYERERQPAVIQEAQRFFSAITSGRYERILSLPGEDRIAVEDRTGARKDSSELSRGTVEQLYLALRFGLVREFGRRSEPMPVILDDILVNFDPGRARETCRALDELSKDQQVILFTCHPETVDLITSENRDCKLFELPSEAG